MNALVIGGDGFIGRNLVKLLEEREIPTRWTSRRRENPKAIFFDMEVSEYDCSSRDFDGVDVVFVCAAMTGFMQCESNPKTYTVNVDAPLRIATSIPDGVIMVHLSTDAVIFATHTAYALQKALVEVGLISMGNAIIIRLPRITAENISGMCRKILVIGQSGKPGLYTLK